MINNTYILYIDIWYDGNQKINLVKNNQVKKFTEKNNKHRKIKEKRTEKNNDLKNINKHV